VVEGEAPDDGVEVVPLFEYADAVVEESLILEFPEDEAYVKQIVIEYILSSKELIYLLIAARSKDVVEGLSL
jgi:hypothetical protein